MSAFSAGPRLLDSPKGDPKRQAIASLRGYAYQLYVSALAWLSLKQGEHLYLEVAEDYATVTKNALEGVQVKDTHQSGNITINSSDVRNTIDAYVDLHERNPNYVVSLRFLSTSSIGQEQEKASRANDEPVLTYWRRAALGAEIAPLRSALAKANLSNRVRQFIDSRDDTSLRKDLLQRIHWDCSRPDLASVRDELRASLIEYGNDKFRMAPSESERLASTVLERVLDSILTSEARRLSAADLLKVFEDSTHVSLPRSTFDAVLQQMSTVVVGGEEGPSFVARSVLEPEHELPVPKYLTKRDAIVARVLGSIQQHGIAFITGSTGFGKTLAARLATRDLGGTWYVLDLRNTSVPESVQLLRRAIGKLATIDLDGLILDDLNEAEAPEVAREVVRLAAALRRRDIRWIATAYREPSSRFMESIGGDAGSHIPIPSFEEAEVAELVAQAGGAVSTWAKLIYMAGGFGHPQLVQALIDGLHTRSWSADDLRELRQLQFINSDVQHEREAARRYLVGTMDDGTRTLLYRTSLLFGRFDRGLALRIGETDPNITNPGEKLDALIGPWIDAVSHGELRISPLVENVGRDMLTREAQLDVHRTAADYITDGESLDILKANSAYLHGLLGNSETALVKIGYAVVRTSTKKRRRLVDWLSGLRFARVDRPIYSNPTIARLLRFSQLLLVAETDDDAKVREVWDVLGKELQNEQNPKLRATFESMVLGSVLINQYLAGVLPNWVDLVLRFDSLAKSDRLLGKMVRSFERTSKPPGGPRSVLGFLFINQALNVRSVAELASVFSKLDSLPADTRDTLFKDVFSMPGDFSLIVSNAWSREHKLGTLDWRTAADQYLSMGRIANLWGYRDLAIRCRVAVGVMLDEYGDDPAAALKALDEAAVAHGDDPVISRARAKIFYRRKDHAAALSLLKENAELIGANDPIERAYMLREAGISAAELGDWAEARTWFQKSAESAAHIKSSTLKTVVTGLRADAAVAILKSGDRVGALGEIVSAIESLESLDPEESIRAAYCHRVVRHTVLWMQGEMTGKIISVENEPPAMLPGMCSNPEPSEEIKSHPLTPIEPVWYVISQMEVPIHGGTVARTNLEKRLKGRTIPALEIMVRKAWLDAALQELDHRAFLTHLKSWAEALLYLDTHRDRLMSDSLFHPTYGTVPVVSTSGLSSQTRVLEDAFLAFDVLGALSHREDKISLLYEECAASNNPLLPPETIEKLRTGAGDRDDRLVQIARAAHAIRGTDTKAIEQLYVSSLRILQLAGTSHFGILLGPYIHDWMKAKWKAAIAEQRFAFQTPSIAIPAIEEALAASTMNLQYAACILLAACSGIAIPISLEFRDFLEKLGKQTS